MTSENHLEILLDNFRLSEAKDYVASLVKTKEISVTRGKACEELINTYEQIICGFLWNEQGLLILSALKNEDETEKDIEEEKKRLIENIDSLIKNKKKALLFFVSAYYAISNMNGECFKKSIDEIVKQINDKNLETRLSETVGGYEKFQVIVNVLEKYYGLEKSIFEEVEKIALNIHLT